MQQIQEYIQTKIAPAEWVGDFRLEHGFYYFTVKLEHDKEIIYAGGSFEVIAIESFIKSTYIKLRIEQNACEFFTASWLATDLQKSAEDGAKVGLSLESAIKKGLQFNGHFFKDNIAMIDFLKQSGKLIKNKQSGQITEKYLINDKKFMSYQYPEIPDIKCDDKSCSINYPGGHFTFY